MELVKCKLNEGAVFRLECNHIFQPITIRGLTFENRIIMPSMGTLMTYEDSMVTQRMIDYYVERAKGGAGLIFAECAAVWPESTQGFALGISDDKFIPGLTELVEAVHAVGGKIGIQIFEAAEGVMNGHADTSKLRIMSPIDKLGGRWKAIPAEELPDIAAAFGAAARRAAQSGFDAIEIHCGHNYLLHQFLSPHFNTRTDEYGGSFENCMKFPLMCIEETRKNWPAEKPLFMRIVAQDDYTYDADGNFNGLTIDDMVVFCKKAKELGVDVLDVSRGNFGRGNIYEVPNMGLPFGFNKDNALYLKQHVEMPVMAVGRLGRPELANVALAQGADFVAWGHAHIADPYIVQKCREGRFDDICYCIGCDQACSQAYHIPEARHISCLRNPAVGREREFELKQTEHPKTVLVAGGGVGGMEAAATLANRGHKVILCEKSDVLGGQFRLAGLAPDKEDFALTVDYMIRQIKQAGVEIRMNTPVTPALLHDLKPDELIIATGGMARDLNVPGGSYAINYADILTGNRKPMGKCVIIGGGIISIEVMEHLNFRGFDTTIVGGLSKLGEGLSHGREIYVQNFLEAHPEIKVITNAWVTKLDYNKVYAHVIEKKTNRRTKETVIVREEDIEVEADTIIAAVGSVPHYYDDLVQAAQWMKIPCHIIGDAKKPRFALDAIREAAEVAREI